MKPVSVFHAARVVCTVLVCLATVAPACAAIRAGFAERDISPEIGMEQPGGYHKSFHRAFHDPCKVRVAVFDDGQKCTALVGVDALAVPPSLVDNARRGIVQRCGIPAQAVLIAASHSHSSGPVGMVQPGEFDHASPLVQKLAYEQSSMANPEYLQRVEQAIIDAVGAAHESRAEVHCGFGSGREDQVAYNRRFRMKNGLSYTHPGQGNPDIVEAAGPVDPEVGVVAVWNVEGQLVGCIVNFACHATTSPGGISANYIYYLEKVIRGVMGDDVVVVFTAGASGDITQVDNLSPTKHPAPEAWAQLVGGRVGAEVVKVMFAIERTAEVPVDFRADAAAYQLSPGFRRRVFRGAEVVHLRDVAGRTGREHHHHVVAHDATNDFLQIINVVGRDAARTGRGVTSKVDDTADELAFDVPNRHHADLRIHRAGRFDNIRIALARVRVTEAVFHAEAAVIGHLVLAAAAESAMDLGAGFMSRADRVDDGLLDALEVLGIGHRGLLVGQLLDQRRSVVELAWLDHANRAGRVRMRSGDQHGLGRDATALDDTAPSVVDQRRGHGQGVDADEGRTLLAVVEHGHTDLAGIVERAMKRFVITARLLHADLRADVPFGKAGADGGARRGHRCQADEHGTNHPCRVKNGNRLHDLVPCRRRS